MSVKRQATRDLNHENWDQDDPEDHEEIGTFKTAPDEVIEKRVIRTARRRGQAAGDEVSKDIIVLSNQLTIGDLTSNLSICYLG